MSQAMLGYGTKFSIEDSTTPGVFTDLGEIFNITAPAQTVDQVDVSHMLSPNQTREFIDGLIDPGECSFQMNYIPGSASDILLLDILSLPVGEDRTQKCKITFTNGVTDSFDANLQSYERDLPTDDKMTATVSWRVTGLITRGTGP